MATNGKYTAKVSDKGAISVYGRRAPDPYYKDEWECV
jgi:hypothetical protein